MLKCDPMNEKKTPIRKVFGDSPLVKVIDVLVENPNLDYTKKELAEAAEISVPTLYKLWDRLEDEDIVVKTRKIGNTELYKLNTDSTVVKEIVRFEQRVLGEGRKIEA